jgi:hypothetical protein
MNQHMLSSPSLASQAKLRSRRAIPRNGKGSWREQPKKGAAASWTSRPIVQAGNSGRRMDCTRFTPVCCTRRMSFCAAHHPPSPFLRVSPDDNLARQVKLHVYVIAFYGTGDLITERDFYGVFTFTRLELPRREIPSCRIDQHFLSGV